MFTKWRSRKLQRGAAALEFAIIVPIFMLLVCAMIDFAMVFNAQAVTANAARDGARAASLGKTFATTGTTISNETSSLISAGTAVSWTVCTAATIDATAWTCSSASGDTAYDNARVSGAIVKVTVNYKYTWITALPNLVGFGSTTTIGQSSYMRIETVS